jgi:hypothetical protein
MAIDIARSPDVQFDHFKSLVSQVFLRFRIRPVGGNDQRHLDTQRR